MKRSAVGKKIQYLTIHQDSVIISANSTVFKNIPQNLHRAICPVHHLGLCIIILKFWKKLTFFHT